MSAPRTTSSLKQHSGTYRADREPKANPAARLAVVPPPPSHFTERAANEWCAIGHAMVGIGTLTTADLRAFELLAQTLATESEARELLARDGMTTTTADGGVKSHPAIRIMETARAQARALLADFGLTPRSRQGINAAPSTSDANPFLRSGVGRRTNHEFQP